MMKKFLCLENLQISAFEIMALLGKLIYNNILRFSCYKYFCIIVLKFLQLIDNLLYTLLKLLQNIELYLIFLNSLSIF